MCVPGTQAKKKKAVCVPGTQAKKKRQCAYQVSNSDFCFPGDAEEHLHFSFLLVTTQVDMATSRTCEKCNRSFKSSLQSHEKNYHTLSITAKYTDSQGVYYFS